jgi:DNA helicase-2/ATP-dependent DNA helicase PcrA
MMRLDQMYISLASMPNRSIKLSPTQKAIIEHQDGPLWVIAGPGSGKTEVLVLRTLRLLLVDECDARSVMVTTFTEKAAKNLVDRLTTYKYHIATNFPKAAGIDLFQLRVGTLHSLCNDLMIEHRFPDYRSCRPLDDIQQLLFIYSNCSLASGWSKLDQEQRDLWRQLEYVWSGIGMGYVYQKNGWDPSRWIRARTAQILFNRMTEDLVRTDKMSDLGDHWSTLAQEYLDYEKILDENFRVDFAHMQKKFLEFLDTPQGNRFVEGNPQSGLPGIKQVLVDEYQDTNPIQERIYLRLAKPAPHNLNVVGDDDQALYRFRGGTVECMINFDRACKDAWGVNPKPIHLVENYRSHPKIVEWINDYVASFSTMTEKGARSSGKPPLLAKSSIQGSWPAVAAINAQSRRELAESLAETVRGLLNWGVVSDPSDCVLLMRSTRESATWAKPFAEALNGLGVNVYNPRGRSYLDQVEIKTALGTLLEIVDAEREYPRYASMRLVDSCEEWRQTAVHVAQEQQSLAEYLSKSRQAISNLPTGTELDSSIRDILYHILSRPPFDKWLDEPSRTLRLGQLTRLLDAYSSTPTTTSDGRQRMVDRGRLRTSRTTPGKITGTWKQDFYSSFIDLIIDGGLNDPEDEEVICPKEYFPIMTVHQAKGL